MGDYKVRECAGNQFPGIVFEEIYVYNKETN